MAPEPGLTIELAREVIDRGDPLTVRSRGWSMGNTIPAGTRVHLQKPTPGSIARGDIVVYESGGRLVGHRVVEKWRAAETIWFLTRGDGREMPDSPLNEGQILARVTGLETEDGRLLPAAQVAPCRLLTRGLALAWRIRQRIIPRRTA